MVKSGGGGGGGDIVHQDFLLIGSLENTNINAQMSQRQRHTANINQIDINLTMLHWTYGASDMYFMLPQSAQFESW